MDAVVCTLQCGHPHISVPTFPLAGQMRQDDGAATGIQCDRAAKFPLDRVSKCPRREAGYTVTATSRVNLWGLGAEAPIYGIFRH